MRVVSSDRAVQIAWTHGSWVHILSGTGHLFVMFCYFLLAKHMINPLNTKHRLFYLKTLSVPRT